MSVSQSVSQNVIFDILEPRAFNNLAFVGSFLHFVNVSYEGSVIIHMASDFEVVLDCWRRRR